MAESPEIPAKTEESKAPAAEALQPPPPKFRKILPKQDQAVGPTGATIPPHICKIMIEAVRSGDLNRFNIERSNYHVELRDIISDPASFSQNLLFAATAIPDEDAALRIIEILIESGVDLQQKDSLKQTPLYYCARDGKSKLVQFFVEQGLNVNEIDTYG